MSGNTRRKWADEEEILRRYEQDIKRADELGLTCQSGVLDVEDVQILSPPVRRFLSRRRQEAK
jgi:hypothetical protein